MEGKRGSGGIGCTYDNVEICIRVYKGPNPLGGETPREAIQLLCVRERLPLNRMRGQSFSMGLDRAVTT